MLQEVTTESALLRIYSVLYIQNGKIVRKDDKIKDLKIPNNTKLSEIVQGIKGMFENNNRNSLQINIVDNSCNYCEGKPPRIAFVEEKHSKQPVRLDAMVIDGGKKSRKTRKHKKSKKSRKQKKSKKSRKHKKSRK